LRGALSFTEFRKTANTVKIFYSIVRHLMLRLSVKRETAQTTH
jgi:hypothetical protein